jgi:hypothetical protein
MSSGSAIFTNNEFMETTRFADLLGQRTWNPQRSVETTPHSNLTVDLNTAAEPVATSAPNGAFAPLPASLPAHPDTLQTLAPTTPSAASDVPEREVDLSDAPERTNAPGESPLLISTAPRVQDVQNKTTAKLSAQEEPSPEANLEGIHATFNLPGLAFQLGGPQEAEHLFNKEQISAKLASMGLKPADASVGFHPLPGGGAIVVRQEKGYHLQHLDAKCVQSLTADGRDALRNFTDAGRRVTQSQQIANLTALVDAGKALRLSAILKCSSSQTFAGRLQLLMDSCAVWATARNKVARLMHQVKSRELQIKTLQEKILTFQDVLGKESDAMRAALAAEKKVASKKKTLILTLTRDLQREIEELQQVATDAQNDSTKTFPR